MARVLIVSDYSRTSHNLEDELSRFGWVADSTTMQTLLSQGSSVTKGYDNIILIIDANFRKNFIGVIGEMESLISNCSKYSAMYLMFEDDYDPIYASWLAHINRMFKSMNRQPDLEEAIKEIIKFSFEPVSNNSFTSPMNGF